jgi:hypothetical protein
MIMELTSGAGARTTSVITRLSIPTSKEVFSMEEFNTQQEAGSATNTVKLETLINQALIDILLNKQLISMDELVNSIGKIRMEHYDRVE